MQRTMVYRASLLTGYASVRYVDVSLPYAEPLVDGLKYREPPVREPHLEASAVIVYATVRDDADGIAFGHGQ
jgi:hypothetical protein